MRYAVTITGFKKSIKKIENFITQSIQIANCEKEAIGLANKTPLVISKIDEGYKLYWQVAMEIPELDCHNTNIKPSTEFSEDI